MVEEIPAAVILPCFVMGVFMLTQRENFWGIVWRMETSSKGCVGNSWPCHWRYTCPQSTTVNWYGVMHAALNHHFPNGTHHVWQPLSGGDRLQLEQATSTVYLHAANNSVGASCGSVRGTIHTLVPYALDGRNANRLVQLENTGGDRPQQVHLLREVPERLPLRRH